MCSHGQSPSQRYESPRAIREAGFHRESSTTKRQVDDLQRKGWELKEAGKGKEGELQVRQRFLLHGP